METKVGLPNVLIVDDEIGPRESLRMILKPHYNVFCVDDGRAALEMVRQVEFDVITLDLRMPGMSGIETLKEIRRIDPDVMIVIITGYGTLESAIEAIRYDVFDFVPKPFNVPEIIAIIHRSIERRRISRKIKAFFRGCLDGTLKDDSALSAEWSLGKGFKALSEIQWDEIGLSESENCLEFARVLATTLEEKDPYTSGHSERVCYYSDFISKRLEMGEKDRCELQIASYLHDIGKVGISSRYINKRGSLTPADWAIIKQHARKSIELLAPLKLSSNILSSIEHHHEHYDGRGYPDGLSGEAIPLGARIIAISDSYDSMTSDRPYRRPIPSEEARAELVKCAGRQFDPYLVSVFIDVLKETEGRFQIRNQLRGVSASL